MNRREKLLQKAARLGLRDLPIGAYVTDPEGRMIEANTYARELFRLPLEGEFEVPVGDFYPAQVVSEKLSQAAGNEGGRAVRSSPTISISVAGREVHLRDYSHAIRDEETGEVIGFLSCVEDVTREYSLRHKVEELTNDIGQTLHTYSSTLVMIEQAASSILDGLKPDPLGDGRFVTAETAVAALAGPARACAAALRELLRLADDGRPAAQALPGGRLKYLRSIAELLSEYERDVPYAGHIPAALQAAAVMLLEILEEVRPGVFPRELIKIVKSSARELVRIGGVFMLHEMRDAATEMEHTVRALREFIITGNRGEPHKSVREASSLLAEAIANIERFARARGVRLRRKVEDGGAAAEVVERDVVRALVNILHNAIKYSWSREGGGDNTWVHVHTYVEDGRLCFRVENYGVPIRKQEIEQGHIFELGYRGMHSGDRGRVGTGIGLADAMRVAREHGGDITVESRPAAANGREDNYNQPFVTSVTFSLPLRGREGNEA
jgi:signal transduction histidine kinase